MSELPPSFRPNTTPSSSGAPGPDIDPAAQAQRDSAWAASTGLMEPEASNVDQTLSAGAQKHDQTPVEPSDQILSPATPPEVVDTLANPPEYNLPTYTDRKTGKKKLYEPTGMLNDDDRKKEDVTYDTNQYETTELWIEPKPLRDLSLDAVTGNLIKAQDTQSQTKQKLEKMENSFEAKAGKKDEQINELRESLKHAEGLVKRYTIAQDVAAKKEFDALPAKSRQNLGRDLNIQLGTIKYRASVRVREKIKQNDPDNSETSAFEDFTKNREKNHPKGRVVKTAEAVGRLLLKKSQKPNRALVNEAKEADTQVMEAVRLVYENTPPGGEKNIGYAMDPRPIFKAVSRIREKHRSENITKKIINDKNVRPIQKAAYLNRFNELNKDPNTRAKEAHKLAKRAVFGEVKKDNDDGLSKRTGPKTHRRPNIRPAALKKRDDLNEAAERNKKPGGIRNISYAFNPSVIKRVKAEANDRREKRGEGRLDWVSPKKRKAEEADFRRKQQKLEKIVSAGNKQKISKS
jgi:hypothetical protein